MGPTDTKPHILLMDLPPEVRNLIWEFVLTPDNRIIAIDVKAEEKPGYLSKPGRRASMNGDMFTLPALVTYTNTGDVFHTDPTSNGRWNISLITRYSFDGILACKQMFHEARDFLSRDGFVLDIKNDTNRPVPIEATLPSARYRDAIKVVFFEFPDPQHLPGIAFQIPGSTPRFILLESVLALPNLEAVAVRKGGAWWPKVERLRCGEEFQTYARKREDEVNDKGLELFYNGTELHDVVSLDVDYYVSQRPGVRVFVEYAVEGDVGCGGTCDERKKTVQDLRALGALVDDEYMPYENCDCDEGSQTWLCTAIRKESEAEWAFTDHLDGKVDDMLEYEVFKWMGEN